MLFVTRLLPGCDTAVTSSRYHAQQLNKFFTTLAQNLNTFPVR